MGWVEREIETVDDLRDVLARVTFAPSCVDMGWEWKFAEVCLGKAGQLTLAAPNGWLVSTTFRRPDRDTSKIERGEGRKWFVARGTTESSVVKTAFAAAKMILEHELAESFRFRGERIFDPHHTVEDLSIPGRLRRAERPAPDTLPAGAFDSGHDDEVRTEAGHAP